MPDDIKTLSARVERRDQTIVQLRKRITQLEEDAARTAEKDVESEDEESNDDDDELPKPIHDEADDTYRCTECAWEVVEGFCEGCQTEFKWTEENEDASLPADSLQTEAANDPDREQAFRGTTPLRDIRPSRPLPGYTREQHEALLQRGATRLMIETFNLEYCPFSGIFAWADSTLYAEFAGPKMQEGHFWKIQLGRRFDLDEDDLDGAGFVEGVLEEAVLFPGKGEMGRWETVEEGNGIWVTRMVAKKQEEAVGNGDVVAPAADKEDGMDEDEEECNEEDDQEGDEEDDQDQDDEDSEEDDDDPDHLEVPFVDDGPVLTCPGYDTTDDYDSDDAMAVVLVGDAPEPVDVDMDEDTGAEIEASIPDAVWDPGCESDEPLAAPAADPGEGAKSPLGPDADVDGPGVGEKDDSDTLESGSDSADSDFDPDEELSGDEELMEHASVISKFKYSYGH